MKVGKDGKLKLSKGERQFGNFIIKNEADYVKISDVCGYFTHRISKMLLMGRMIEGAFKDKEEMWLEHYAALVWYFSNVVADPQFFLDINKACHDCAHRHPELYGINEDLTEEEDKEILEEVKESERVIGKMREELEG